MRLQYRNPEYVRLVPCACPEVFGVETYPGDKTCVLSDGRGPDEVLVGRLQPWRLWLWCC